jgi:hypothetical protein
MKFSKWLENLENKDVRRILSMPAPTELPENHEDYFILNLPGTIIVPIDKLIPTRARPQGIANAEKFMNASRLGEKKIEREPLSISDNGDGTYNIEDGNSTYATAVKFGWKTIPAIEVMKEAGIGDNTTVYLGTDSGYDTGLFRGQKHRPPKKRSKKAEKLFGKKKK